MTRRQTFFEVVHCPLDMEMDPPQAMYRAGLSELSRSHVSGELELGRFPSGMILIDNDNQCWMVYPHPEHNQVLVAVEDVAGSYLIQEPVRITRHAGSGLSLREEEVDGLC